MKKIMVTGGLGFIGSNFIQMVLTNQKYKDVKIINIDCDQLGRKNHKHLSHIEAIKDINRYQYRNANICNLTRMQALVYLHKPDTIVHFAAETHVDLSIQSPREYAKANILGTINLLIASSKLYNKLLSKKEKQEFRFHHISTDEVFGDFPIDSIQKFNEHSKYYPSSPYSATKASADMLVHAWHRSYGLPISMSNCSNNYGKYQDNTKLIPKVISHCLKEEEIPIHGSGQYIRDWIHVEDHCRGILAILDNLDKTDNETFLFGGDCERSNIYIINYICELMDKMKPRKNGKSYKQLQKFVQNRVGQDNRYAIDNTKSNTVLGWHPQKKLQDSLIGLI